MPTNARRQLVALVACIALLAVACSDDGGSASTTTAEATSTTLPAVPRPCGSTDAQLLALVRAASAAAHEAQVEMLLSAASMSDEATDELDPPIDADLVAQRERTDEAIEAFLASVDDAAIDHDAVEGADLVASIRSANEPIHGLNVTRVAVDEIQVTTTIARQSFAALAQSLVEVIASARWCLQGSEAANQLIDQVLGERYKATTAELGALIMSITTSGEIEELDREDLERLITRRIDANLDFNRLAYQDPRGKLIDRLETGGANAANDAITQVIETPDGSPVPITPEEWRPLALAQLDDIRAWSTESFDVMSEGAVEACISTAADEGLVNLVAAASDAAYAAQLEALRSAASMATEHTDAAKRDDLDAQRILTDDAVTAFAAAAGSVPIDERTAAGMYLTASIRSAEDRIRSIGDARRAIDELQVSVALSRDSGAQLATTFVTIIGTARWCAERGGTVNQLLDLALLSSYKAAIAGIDAQVAAITTVRAATQPDREDLDGLLAGSAAAELLLSDLGSGELLAHVRTLAQSNSEATAAIGQVVETKDDAPVPVTGAEWMALAHAQLEGLHGVEADLVDQIRDGGA